MPRRVCLPLNTSAFSGHTLSVAVSLAFAWILWPFYGAVLWGTIVAIVFVPVYRRLSRAMGHRRNLAALATVTERAPVQRDTRRV